MIRTIEKLFPTVVGLTALAMAAALYLTFFYAPVEQSMGVVQKIFYVHVPAAMAMYAGFTVTSLASVCYLFKADRVWDMAAVSGAEVGLVFCVYVLISGPLWAYKAWGTAWTWDPQLTATFVLLLLYGGYGLMRGFAKFWGAAAGLRKSAAVLAVVAFVDIPVIHYAVKQWGGMHPVVEREGGGGLAPEMKVAFTVAMVAFLGLTAVLFWMRMRVRLTERAVDHLYLDVEDARRVLDGRDG